MHTIRVGMKSMHTCNKRRPELPPHKKLIILADSGPGVGWGHLSRGLALAQAWQLAHGQAHLIVSTAPNWVVDQCRRDQIEITPVGESVCGIIDPMAVKQVIGRADDATIVFDGYRFNGNFEKQFVAARFLVSIDDFGHDRHDSVDLIVNPNVYASPRMYPHRQSQVLAGPRFVFLRREFREISEVSKQSTNSINRVLLSFGGSEQGEITFRVAKLLIEKCSETSPETPLHLDVFLHGASKELDALRNELAARGVNHVIHGDSCEFAAIAGQADLAIGAAGSILNELVFLGVPTIAIAIAENQVAVGNAFADCGAIRFLSALAECKDTEIQNVIGELANSSRKRRELSKSACGLLDGDGAGRVADRIAIGRVGLRPVRISDCDQLLELRNESVVREFSFEGEIVAAECHRNWLQSKINDRNCLFWVAVGQSGEFLGQARVDVDSTSGEGMIGVSIVPRARGLGLAEWLIRVATDRAIKTSHISCIAAHIKPRNLTSIRAFEGAGFVSLGEFQLPGGRSERALKFMFHSEQAVAVEGV